MNPPVPISAQELKDLRAQVKQLDQQLEGLQNKAAAEEAHPAPAGEPPARPNRVR